MNLLPYFRSPPGDLTITRARLRLVSRFHYAWDERFQPPVNWRRAYIQAGRIEPVARLLKWLAFVGWELLPPCWDGIKICIPVDDPVFNWPAPVEANSTLTRPTAPAAPLHGNFGSRQFEYFHVTFKLASQAAVDITDVMDTAGVIVAVGEPDPLDHTIIRMENVHFERTLFDGTGAIALRHFLQAMQLIGNCSLSTLDGALILAYRHGLPRIEETIFWDDDDDDDDEEDEVSLASGEEDDGEVNLDE